VYVLADVFRAKYGGLSKAAIGGYTFHGLTAILALWLVIKALGA